MKFTLVIDKKKDEEVVATVHTPSPLTEQIEQLVMEYGGTNRIAAFTEDDLKMLPFADIECIMVEDDKTWAIDGRGKKYRLKRRLYEVEALLPSFFIRINKSAIANEKHLDRFTTAFSGAVDAVFKSGHREYVSRRCFAEIKRRFDKL